MVSEISGGLRSISLPTWIQVITIAAALVGQWFVMNEQIKNVTRQIEANSSQIAAIDQRLDTVERTLDRMDERMKNLDTRLTELRRQAGFRTAPASQP